MIKAYFVAVFCMFDDNPIVLGEPHVNSRCAISDEFAGFNPETSHNGLFKITAQGIDQKILDDIWGIKVSIWGTYASDGATAPSRPDCAIPV